MPAFTVIKNNVQQRIVKLHDKTIDDALVTAEAQLTAELTEGETFVAGAYPKDLFKFVDGEPEELTEQEAAALRPNIRPPAPDVLLDNALMDIKSAGLATLATLPPVDAMWTAADAKNAIDQAAGRARFRVVSQGTLIDQEYALLACRIKDWRTAGSIAGNVPAMLQNYATNTSQTAENAAQQIEIQVSAFEAFLETTHNIRHAGKAAIDAAETDFCAAAAPYISELDSL
ncbi:hypothetical protein [Neptunicella sp. SCSIO 80796]|uniref:hypothetical protein n=1 Tax=Neptunicella plasticusilytica TaxID=3117012 RepID=UPI003A4D55B1